MKEEINAKHMLYVAYIRIISSIRQFIFMNVEEKITQLYFVFNYIFTSHVAIRLGGKLLKLGDPRNHSQ